MVVKIKKLILIAIPALVMIGLISFIKNDYLLTLIYFVIIVLSLLIKREPKDLLALFFGFFVITFFEYVFVKAGVETFDRNTLFGIMPLWLPVLWGYGFMLIKRSIIVIDK